jgi:hypothetical protein
LRLAARVSGGGSMVYCLKTFHGTPGPNATVRDAGVMTFSLNGGSIRANVRIIQRFAADGTHAHQSLTGDVVGGEGRYHNARGTIVGGGTDVEAAPGDVTRSDLQYRITLRLG